MKANLPAREPELLSTWEETGFIRKSKNRDGPELFVLHDGPPFANGDVHGHCAITGKF
jgi:isoleucyl-tRNA synthetase